MSYFKNKKAYSTTCGWKTDYRNNDEKIRNTRNNQLIWGNFGIIYVSSGKIKFMYMDM